MLVFSKAKLVILSVPKTGTTAMESFLGPHADILVKEPPELKHAPVYRYNRFFRPMLEKFVDPGIETMAVMREPISWLGSWYRYRQRPFMEGKANATHGISFDDFVLAYCQGKQPPFANVGSQAKFLEPQPNGTRVTHLFRYEDQPAIHRFLEARLGLTLELDQENVSPRMELALSAEVEDKLRRKCAEEFALWDSIG
ncbi:gamma-glutamyl kinase [Pseudooceanicola nanhaiensis]|uniref:gamma-glutamyl kinase n=1 Tax=Pseudooceanicola nanhaiensis TaxID=375761 RepID=UPI001CD1FDD2|nr:gamma-glutamyl kinase [Pseudooceanicola nanhaiensis]MCA0920727.1 gamma-glutamyl kinase [Pseudooceanicola nanhaiensis]